MRKEPGYIARMYSSITGRFRRSTKTGEYLLGYWDFKNLEQRALAYTLKTTNPMDFAAAAGATLAAVNADPRNHFGKHALRRFDK